MSEDETRRLHPVEYDFWWPQRPEISWQVLALRGREAISTPYRFELDLICDEPSIDAEELLGADCELLLDRHGVTRVIFGVVAELEIELLSAADAEPDRVSVRVLLVPAFALLEQDLDTRFFMGQTVIEILRDRLGPALADYGRELDFESRIVGAYNRRDYCVQFRESTFAFCSRIMEEEGIAYVYVPDHEGQRETMVLVDDNAAYGAVELLVPGSVPMVATAPEEIDRESVQRFEWRRKPTPNRVVTRGYNLKNIGRFDDGLAEDHDAGAGRGRAVIRTHHVDGDRRQIIDDPVADPEALSFTGASLDQRGAMATRLLQGHAVAATRGRGRSNAIGFAAGGSFALGEVEGSGSEGEQQLIVRVQHYGEVDPSVARSGAYHNEFETIPKRQPFRPAPRTPRPRVYGVQTGVVVGRKADEVYTDPLGRVRVKFHRDRSDSDDEHSSCWIRVAQMWAGNGYGAMIIPRVGMEVVVAFVDGNPDCPLVTGSVYNGGNAPPYPLPSELSKSTFKTRTTPGGEGFNELRIEDDKGREQIFVHAQGRMDLRARGKLLTTSVGGREDIIGSDSVVFGSDAIEGSHNTRVYGEINYTAEYLRTTFVGGPDSIIVYDDVLEGILGSHYVAVEGTSQLTAPKVLVEASEYLNQTAGRLELVGTSLVSVKGGDRVVVQSNNAIEFVVGQSFISITPTGISMVGGTIRINSGGGVEGMAADGREPKNIEIEFPVEPLAADDGSLRSGGGGGGGGRRRGGRGAHRASRVFEAHRAPPMAPMKPSRPDPGPRGGRSIVQMHWLDQAVLCSEPARLLVETKGYSGPSSETLLVHNAADGDTQYVEVLQLKDGTATYEVLISDVLPRRGGDGFEGERALLASLPEGKTPVPLPLRFITSIPKTRYAKGYSRFNLTVDDHAVTIGGTIEYTRGWIYYIIRLDDLVPPSTGGRIGGRYYGSEDWRYCKRADGTGGLLYWDGAKWVPVPAEWSSDLGTRLHGMGVWREPDGVKQQLGALPWPDTLPTNNADDDDWIESSLIFKAARVNDFWSEKFDIKRVACRGHDVRCCRYRVSCHIHFKQVPAKGRGIVIAQNNGRANSEIWPVDASDRTFYHEWGHHMGNPDEYEGAGSVDPTVNDDGARAGIDNNSIMGGDGKIVRRRHFNTVCTAMAQAVATHLGKTATYRVVEPA